MTTNAEILVAARHLRARGLSPILLHAAPGGVCTCGRPDCGRSSGKHPVFGKWETREWCREDEEATSNGTPRNLGIRLGGSGRLVALDVDGLEGIKSLDRLERELGALPDTLTQRTGGGEHRIFRMPQGYPMPRNSVGSRSGLAANLDLRAEGGQIVVAPSVHRTGRRYEWVDPKAPIAELPPAWAERLTRRTEPDRPREQRADERTSRYALGALNRACENIRSASEGVRNDTLNAEAFGIAQLVGGRALDHGVAWRALEDAAVSTGLGERETGATLASAFAAGAKEPRSVPEPEPRERTAPARETPEPPPMPGDDEAAEAPKPATGLVVRSVSEIFVDLPPVPWLCQPLGICPGAPALIAGYGFSGKTVVAQHIAIAVAGGLRALGTFTVRKGRVVHVDYEQGFRLTAERYQRICRAEGIGPSELEERLGLVAMPPVYLDSPGAEDAFSVVCDGSALLIVDSLRAAAPTIDENSSEARLVLDLLTRISERTGCSVLILHHARKPQALAVGGARMSIRGTGGLYDACSTCLVLEAEKNQPTIVHHEKERVTGRTQDDFLLLIEDEEANGDPRGGLRVQAQAATECTAPRTENIQQRITDLLAERRSVPSFNALVELIRQNRGRTRAALDLLVDAGTVEERALGRGRREIILTGRKAETGHGYDFEQSRSRSPLKGGDRETGLDDTTRDQLRPVETGHRSGSREKLVGRKGRNGDD